MRRRDERFATHNRYTVLPGPLHDKSRTAATQTLRVFTPNDFAYDAKARTCKCPAGKSRYRQGARNVAKGLVGEHCRGATRECVPCAMRAQCLRTPDTTHVRNVAFIAGRADPVARIYTAEMKGQLDTPDGRRQYGERFAAVEPVFGNLRAQHRKYALKHPRDAHSRHELADADRTTCERCQNRLFLQPQRWLLQRALQQVTRSARFQKRPSAASTGRPAPRKRCVETARRAAGR